MDRSDAVAQFTRMEDGTKEDFEILERIQEPFANELADRVLEQLRQLGGSYGGMLVDRLIHSLQTATRAHRDGRDEEYVVCALLHDIGDMLATHNHADLAAAILKPFVSEKNLWIVEHHAIFQGYYFWHHVGAKNTATTPTSMTPPNSARSTTSARSIRTLTRCHSSTSSRCCGGYSQRRNGSKPKPNQGVGRAD